MIDVTSLDENNIVLRAELAAIHVALVEFQHDDDLKIATDSLTALQIIHALLIQPAEREWQSTIQRLLVVGERSNKSFSTPKGRDGSA